MRIDIDLDSNLWVSQSGTRYGVQEVEFKRATSSSLDVRFWRSGAIVELAAGALGKFAIKPDGEFDAAPLVLSETWTKSGTGSATVYRFTPDFNGEALADLLGSGDGDSANDERFIAAMAEIRWEIDGAISRTQTVAVRVYNDVIKDEDGTPLSVPSPEDWLDAQRPPTITRTAAEGPPDVPLIRVAGTLSADGEETTVFADMPYRGLYGGKNRYADQAGSSEYSAEWSSGSSRWELRAPMGGLWTSTENVATPDLVNTWTPQGDSTGSPDVTLYAALPSAGIGQMCIVGDAAADGKVIYVSGRVATGVQWILTGPFLAIPNSNEFARLIIDEDGAIAYEPYPIQVL